MLALIVHFSMLLMYRQGVAPRSKSDFYSLAYVYPFFQQSWQLFAPPPDSNYHLFANFENQNGTQKKDIFQEILIKHRSNRLKGYEPILIAFTNSIHYFEKNTQQRKSMNGPIKDELYFKMIEHSALNYLKSTCGEEVEMRQLILLVEDVNTKHCRVYYNVYF